LIYVFMILVGISDMFNVSGKIVLVTGGGRGIGRMITEGFVRNGATVFISSRDAKAVEGTANELTSKGPGKCIGLSLDLATVEGVRKLVSTLREQHGVTKLNVLINNSGNSWGEPLDTFSENGWDRVMTLNVKSVFFLTQAALPLLEAGATVDDPARIINIASVAGMRIQAVPTWSYDVSKAALIHLTEKFANELAKRHITANAICPGFVPTKMSNQLLTYASEEQLRNKIPLGRFAVAEDMAGIALFYASRAGSWVSGTHIAIDGGQTVTPAKL